MPEDSAISRSVLAEQVKDRLLQDILSGRYPPHSRIVETRVAREVGTSQAPVREALRGLEALGVVEILPFRGARVRRPGIQELLEAYAVRSELESLGARLGIPRMTDEDLAEIEALHETMQLAAETGDRHEVAVRDAAFHARLLALAGNRRWSASGDRWSRSPGRTSRSSRPARTRSGPPTCTRGSSRPCGRGTRRRSSPRCGTTSTRRPRTWPRAGSWTPATAGAAARRGGNGPPGRRARPRSSGGQARPRIASTCSATLAADSP